MMGYFCVYCQVYVPTGQGVDGVLATSNFSVDELVLTQASLNSPLPDNVDNSLPTGGYFPDVFKQEGESCLQASEIGYCFTYEMNRLRNVPAGDWESHDANLYSPFYTYNFLNDGSSTNGTFVYSGFNLAYENGIPMFDSYYDIELEGDARFAYWMTGYEKYLNGKKNTISDVSKVTFTTDYNCLLNLKHWLADHNEGQGADGGVATICVFNHNEIFQPVSGSVLPIITQLSLITSHPSHALSVVGYDENIGFDFNGDGQITTTIDINGDGNVNLLDRELGALLVVNSIEGWGYYQKAWLPYKLLPTDQMDNDFAHMCHAEDADLPEYELRVEMEHNSRGSINLWVAKSIDANSAISAEDYELMTAYNRNGGVGNTMRGTYLGPIELALNFGKMFEGEDFGKVGFRINEVDHHHQYDGEVISLSLIDYRWGETFEIFCEQENVPIVDWDDTFMTIDYDLIPHELPITSDLLLYSDMVSRFNPIVDGANKTLTVNNIDIDMYSSTITIKDGAKMVINDGAVFRAKQGTCRIEIEGDIQIGNNVHFIADPGATLEIVCSNPEKSLNISNCEFENCIVTSSTHIVSITNSNFVNSNVYCENGRKDDQPATITNNTFVDGSEIAIDLYDFKNYFIEQNSINNMKCGVMLTKCGDGIPGNQTIANNDIIDCTTTGIHLYESVSYISENLVSLCNEGVRLENKSTTSIYGNPNATSYTQMNRFYNEDSYELYISKYSFPWYFHYNAIIDNDNGGNIMGDPLLYYDNVSDVNQPAPKNVEYNCWGTNFNALMDLYPINGFDYSPTYCPPSAPMLSSPVETLYQNSLDQFTAGDYTQSKAGFMFLIDQYPSTKYAQSAMRELVNLEVYAGNDYESLKTYYQTNSVIQADTILIPLASKLANECNIKLENYTEAVTYFEGVIADPADTQDSVYAIIDLGYLYETMETGNKASYVGKMPQYKPKSVKQFNKYKLDLLSLLPVEKGTQTGQDEVDVFEENGFTIHPNPLNESTTFGYTIQKEGYVEFRIFATDGTPVQTINKGIQNSGSHEYTYHSLFLDAGIYYCSLVVDNVILETRKMIVIR